MLLYFLINNASVCACDCAWACACLDGGAEYMTDSSKVTPLRYGGDDVCDCDCRRCCCCCGPPCGPPPPDGDGVGMYDDARRIEGMGPEGIGGGDGDGT
jgi:hypothetical protein